MVTKDKSSLLLKVWQPSWDVVEGGVATSLYMKGGCLCGMKLPGSSNQL